MLSIKKFLWRQLIFLKDMFVRDSTITGIKEVAKRSVARFLRDLQLRLEERIDELDVDEVLENLIGWMTNMSATVPAPEDTDGILEAGANDSDEGNMTLDIGSLHFNFVPPKPIPPALPCRQSSEPRNGGNKSLKPPMKKN